MLNDGKGIIMDRSILSTFALLALTVLIGCGGGGSSDSTANDYSITLDKSSVAIETRSGGEHFPAQYVKATYNGDGVVVGLPPGSTLPDWIIIEEDSSGSGWVQYKIYIDPNVTLTGVASFSRTVRFTTGKQDGSVVVYSDLRLNISILDSLIIDLTPVSESAYSGSSPFESSSIEIVTNAQQWSIESNQSWLSSSIQSGVGTGVFSVEIDPTNLQPGNYQGELTISDNRDSFALNVNLDVLESRIFTQDMGFAFIQSPEKNVSAKSFMFFSNNEMQVGNLSITSKPNWLTVEQTDPGRINLQLVSNSLDDGLYCDLVSLNEVESGRQISLHGCLYKASSTNLYEGSIASYTGNTSSHPMMVSAFDTVRPYAYVLDKTSLQINAYNIYTGELIHSLPSSASLPDSIVVSDDGLSLFARNKEGVEIYNLVTRSKDSSISGNESGRVDKLSFVRIDGMPFIYDRLSHFFNLEKQTHHFLDNNYNTPHVSEDGKVIYVQYDFEGIIKNSLSYDEQSNTLIKGAEEWITPTTNYKVYDFDLSENSTYMLVAEKNGQKLIEHFDNQNQLLSSYAVSADVLGIVCLTDRCIIREEASSGSKLSINDFNGNVFKVINAPAGFYGENPSISPYNDRLLYNVVREYYSDYAETHLKNLE